MCEPFCWLGQEVPIDMHKTSFRVEGHSPTRVSDISSQNLLSRLHKKQNGISARRVIRFAGSPFLNGRVTLQTGPTLAIPAGSTNVYTGRLRPRSNPCRFYIPFFRKKVPLSFTFYRQIVPLSYTLFRTLHPF